MEAISFLLNQDSVEIRAAPGKALLDILRQERRLTGTKEACREGDCGACMVLLGRAEGLAGLRYAAVNSCLLPLWAVAGRHVVTIEGLSGSELNPIQQALVDQGGIQCGFCTPGIVIALTAFFLNGSASDVEAAIDAAAGNLCRCTGYSGIKRAIRALCLRFDLGRSALENRFRDCIDWELLPSYFGSITERLDALPPAKAAATDPHAVKVAGGTDLFVQRPAELAVRPLVFLEPCENAEAVRIKDGRCLIDASATIEQLRTSSILQSLFPEIRDDFKLICSAPVRNRATLGGNLVNASPIGDLAVFFLALDASLHLVGPRRLRSVKLRDFFKAYKQVDCGPEEQVREISFDLPGPSAGFSFEKVSKRTYLDIASVNSALAIEWSNGVIQKVHLAAGGVGPVPMRLSKACGYLAGKTAQPATILEAAEIAQAEIAPISDIRGSAEYKRLLLRQLIFAHFLKLFPDRLSAESLNETA